MMLAATVLRSASSVRAQITSHIRRNIYVSSVLTQGATAQNPPDIIQQLFITKIREYAQKTKAAGGKLVDADPVAAAALKQEMDKLATQFGATGQDFSKFPTFKFSDKTLETVYSDPNFLDMFESSTEEVVEIVEDEDEQPEIYKYY